MIRNLREIILNRIAEIIKGNDYDEITVLDLLKRSPGLWEDSIIHVTQL